MTQRNSLVNLLFNAEGGDGNGGGQQLTPDQQKIVAATAQIAASQPSTPEGVKVEHRAKIVKPLIGKGPSEDILKVDFGVDDDAPEDLKEIEGNDGNVKKVEVAPVKTVEQLAAEKKAKEDEAKKKADEEAARKSVEDASKGQQQKKESKTQSQAVVPPVRDLTGFAPEEQEILKRMDNNAFQHVSKLMKDYKELQNKPVDNPLLQHENGYLLTPEFNKSVADSQMANFEANHWKKQLISIRKGEKWQGLQGYDAQGNPVYSGPYKASDEAEIDVNNAMTAASTMANQLQGQISTYQQNFKANMQNEVAAINKVRGERFPWVADPKALDEVIDIPDVGKKKIADVRNDFKGLFSGVHRGSIIMEVAADLFATVQKLRVELNAALAKSAVAVREKQEVLEMEPSTEGGDGGQGQRKQDLVFDMEGAP